MSTTAKTPQETALNMIWSLSSMFAGGIFALAPSIEETADAIEASTELAEKLERMREYNDAAEAVCRKAQPLLDARAAMRAIESALEPTTTP